MRNAFLSLVALALIAGVASANGGVAMYGYPAQLPAGPACGVGYGGVGAGACGAAYGFNAGYAVAAPVAAPLPPPVSYGVQSSFSASYGAGVGLPAYGAYGTGVGYGAGVGYGVGFGGYGVGFGYNRAVFRGRVGFHGHRGRAGFYR